MLAIASVVTPAYAQMIDGPPGSTSGVFGGHHAINPNRSAQTFETNFDLSGGYDRDPYAIPTVPAGGTVDPGWPTAEGIVAASYRVGSVRRSLDARARGMVNYQGNTHIPLAGGGGTLNGITTFGRRGLNRLQVNADASYEPGWVFGAVNPELPAPGEAPPLDITPVIGISEQRWLTMSGTAAYQQYWNARFQTSIEAGGGKVQPVGDAGLTSEWQNAMLSQSWAVRSGFDLTGSYRFDRSLQVDEAAQEPIRYQTANLGVRFGKRLSPVRRLNFSVAGGATLLAGSTAAGDAVYPAASLAVEFIASRTLSMSVTANRQVAVLAGVSATPLENDTFSANLNGTIGRRLRIAITGNYMQGTTISAEATSGTTIAGGGHLSVRYGFASWFGTFATYSYYQHRLPNDLQAAAGLPQVYDRHSVRAGFTLWLPLYGTF